MAYGTAKAAGWHDRKGELLTKDHAYFQLAGLTRIKMALGRVVEAIRKPDKFNLQVELECLHAEADVLQRLGPAFAAEMIDEVGSELGTEAQGSLTEILAWLNLIDSEGAEAMEAAIKGDKENFAEELGDKEIRIGDLVGGINDTPGHRLGPIDLESTIQAKNERNRQRDYRHGGKRA